MDQEERISRARVYALVVIIMIMFFAKLAINYNHHLAH